MELLFKTEASVGDYIQVGQSRYQVIGFEVADLGNDHYEPMYVFDEDGVRACTPVFAVTDSTSQGGEVVVKSLYNVGNGIEDIRPILFPCGDSTGIVVSFEYLVNGKWVDEYHLKNL